jgi:hypothetical protein
VRIKTHKEAGLLLSKWSAASIAQIFQEFLQQKERAHQNYTDKLVRFRFFHHNFYFFYGVRIV